MIDLSNFIAAFRSVGMAATMASAGIYLHRQDYISPEGKKQLAFISQQVTIPALLFSKIVYCKQDSSIQECTNIMDLLHNASILLLWPIYTVGCGLLVGCIILKFVSVRESQRSLVYASCALGNSTGLPITLLAVIRSNFSSDTEIGQVDPALFLSVYLLTYPMLQWGVGSFLLSPDKSSQKVNDPNNNKQTKKLDPQQDIEKTFTSISSVSPWKEIVHTNESKVKSIESPSSNNRDDSFPTEKHTLLEDNQLQHNEIRNHSKCQWWFSIHEKLWLSLTTFQSMVSKSLSQPPVIGSLLGFLLSSMTSLRGLFVDMVDRNDNAPLEWFFDGIYAVGQAAVPINMIILGVSLSKAFDGSSINKSQLLPVNATISIIMGKMVIMPAIGICTTCLLNYYLLDIPEGIDGPLYLVMMIVFITPTANNVMVMVELSNSASKEGLAKLIAWQYLLAPLLLSINLAVIVSLVSTW